MGCAMGSVRYILFFFNFLLALAGIGILVLGVVTIFSKGTTLDNVVHGQLSTPSIVFSVVGACVFVFAFFGCCGALRESHCMLCTYAVLLLTLFVVQVAVAVVAYVYQSKTQEVVTQGVENIFSGYQTSTEDQKIVDSIQQQFECCGSSSNLKPWSVLDISRPASCYKGNTTSGTLFPDGCIPVLTNLVKNALKMIGEVAIIVGVVEVIGIIFSMCLASSIRRAELRGYA